MNVGLVNGIGDPFLAPFSFLGTAKGRNHQRPGTIGWAAWDLRSLSGGGDSASKLLRDLISRISQLRSFEVTSNLEASKFEVTSNQSPDMKTHMKCHITHIKNHKTHMTTHITHITSFLLVS